MTAAAEPEIGKARVRKEDQHLITGRTRWTDNIQLPGMLHASMVRSPFAHARITSIDTSAAKESPNVVAVITGAEVAGEQGTMITAWAITTDQKTPEHPPIAVDRATFAGEVVAVVVARSAAEARDAAELVEPRELGETLQPEDPLEQRSDSVTDGAKRLVPAGFGDQTALDQPGNDDSILSADSA